MKQGVQTARKAGVPEFEAINWNGYVAHSATPPAVIARLNAEINRVLNIADVRELPAQPRHDRRAGFGGTVCRAA